MENNTFVNSSSSGSGGAVYLCDTTKATNLVGYNFSTLIKSNTFERCSSKQGGGAIYMQFYQTTFENYEDLYQLEKNNNYFLNSAIYGPIIATPPFYLLASDSGSSLFGRDIKIDIFEDFRFNIDYKLVDFYLSNVEYPKEYSPIPEILLTGNESTYLSTPYIKNTSPISYLGNMTFQNIKQSGNKGEIYYINATLLNSPIKVSNVVKAFMVGCPLGYVSSGGACFECESAKYSFDSENCINCPSFNLLPNVVCEKSNNGSQYSIPEGFWLFPNYTNPKLLIQCSPISNCTGITCGYSTNFDQKSAEIVCFQSGSNSSLYQPNRTCLDDFGCGFCSPGYEGFLCSKCSQGYFKNNKKCVVCIKNKTLKIVLTYLLIPFVVICLILTRNLLFLILVEILSFSLLFIFGLSGSWNLEVSFVLVFLIIIIYKKDDNFSGRESYALIKIFIFYIQINYILLENVVWAPFFENFFSYLSYFDFRFDAVACEFPTFEYHYIYYFYFEMFIPFFLSILLVVIIYLQNLISPKIRKLLRRTCKKRNEGYEEIKERKFKNPNLIFFTDDDEKLLEGSRSLKSVSIVNQPKEEEEELDELETTEDLFENEDVKQYLKYKWKFVSMKIFLFVIFVSYFDISKTIVQLLNCGTQTDQSMKTPSYIVNKPWIVCDSSSYHLLFFSSIFFVIIFILGVPLFFGFLLIRNHYKIKRDENVEWLSFFYENYKKRYYWFELVWMIRRMLIVFFFYMFSQSPHLQKSSIISVLLFFIFLIQVVKPFKTFSENILELMCSIVTLLNTFLPQTEPSFSISLVILLINTFFLLFLLFVFLGPLWKKNLVLKKFFHSFNKLEEFPKTTFSFQENRGEDHQDISIFLKTIKEKDKTISNKEKELEELRKLLSESNK